jgi:regulator of protease activity HflC (stomatin/prohibitin superfamily)
MLRWYVTMFLALALAACGQVDPGERAVFVKWGEMEQKSYSQGLYFYNPISTNMDLVDIQLQAFEAKNLGAATKDLQEVHATVVVNFTLDAEKVHLLLTQVGHTYRDKVLMPALMDALKAGTAHFDIGEIIKERAKLRTEVTKALQARVAPYFINVADNGVNLTNFEVSKAYMQAVEQKQIAEQNVIKATREAESVKAQARGAADAAREQAQGTADSLKIEANARAEYNRKIAESLTPTLLQNRAIDAWREGGSQVPHIVTGGAGVLIQVPMPQPKAEK